MASTKLLETSLPKKGGPLAAIASAACKGLFASIPVLEKRRKSGLAFIKEEKPNLSLWFVPSGVLKEAPFWVGCPHPPTLDIRPTRLDPSARAVFGPWAPSVCSCPPATKRKSVGLVPLATHARG